MTANNNKQATSPTVRAWFHPCVHCGEPSNYGAGGTVGELKGSTLLLHSDPQSGTGYHFAETHNNYYGCVYYINNKIRRIAHEWNKTYCNRPIGIIRVSPQFGRKSTGNSHQNGLDVDVRYVRTLGTEALDLDAAAQRPYYDAVATQYLVDLFAGEGAETFVVFDEALENHLPRLDAEGATFLRRTDHRNHIHVRFPNPSQPPPGADDCLICPFLCSQ